MKLRMRSGWLGALGLGLGGCGGLGATSDSFSPVLQITSPLTQLVRSVVAYSANALDDTGVARVRFLVDGVLLFEDNSAPYVTDWDTTTTTDGPHTLRVDADDISGNRSSVSRSVIVNNAPPN